MGKIKFIESTHQYISDEDKELISVSKFTEKFKEEVDWEEVARKVATKERKAGKDVTYKDVLLRWENKRNLSATIGTLYHTIREKELMDELDPVFYGNVCNKKECDFEEGFKYSIPITQLENNTVYPELMIYDLDYMICGQSDKVIVSDNKIHIWDYKTDAEIKFKAFSSIWVKPKKMLPPLSHLDDANGIHYSIKMSLYMYMLWKANKGRFKPGELIIEHIHLRRDKDNDNIPILQDGKPVVEKIEKISLPYRKKEVMDMLETLNIKK